MSSGYYSLTLEERADLGQAELEYFCKLEAISKGIPIPGPEPKVPQKDPAHDCMVFEVYGICTTDENVAHEIRQILERSQDSIVHLRHYYDPAMVPYIESSKLSDFAVVSRLAYTKERAYSPEVMDYYAHKAKLQREHTDWVADTENYRKVTQDIREDHRKAKQIVEQRKVNQKRFDEYLKILDGDGAKAWFLFRVAGLALPDFTPKGAVTDAS